MQAADRQTIEDFGIDGFTLMESAGRRAIAEIEKHYGSLRGKSVLICCGKGNNGGDGLVMARYAFERGAHVHVGLVSPDFRSPESTRNARLLDALRAYDPENRLQLFDLADLPHARDPLPDLIVDALLGTGLTRDLTPTLQRLVNWINAQPQPTISVDVPTGLHSDDGRVLGQAIRADLTITMGAFKTGLLFDQGLEYAGSTTVADIGIPHFILAKQTRATQSGFRATDATVKTWWPKRPRTAHKYRVGYAVVVAGSPGLTGAAAMAAQATARIGAGGVMCGTPASCTHVLATKLTEVMPVALPETDTGYITEEGMPTLAPHLKKARALLVGCGLGRHPETSQFVRNLLTKNTLPTVIDADGLHALIGHTDLLVRHAQGRWVLTPHQGEFNRLAPETTDLHPIEAARTMAQRWNCVVLLKGMPSVVAAPDGTAFINATGNAATATAGTGDILAGFCTGLLAQGLSPIEAVVSAVHIGGATADAYIQHNDPRTMLATDLLDLLPAVIQTRFTA